MYGLFRVAGVKLTKIGSNMNRRYYVGIVWGAYPGLPASAFKSHSQYPWWKRWRMKWVRGTVDKMTSDEIL